MVAKTLKVPSFEFCPRYSGADTEAQCGHVDNVWHVPEIWPRLESGSGHLHDTFLRWTVITRGVLGSHEPSSSSSPVLGF